MYNSMLKELADLPPNLQQEMLAELHKIARAYMSQERAAHTLQATALVNEAFVKLAEKSIDVIDQHHFLAIAAQQMRRTLVDYARERLAKKRGGEMYAVTYIEDRISDIQQGQQTLELLYLDELLSQLAQFDPRAATIFELKLFSSLNNSDISAIIGTSLATVERDLAIARAWMKSQLKQQTLPPQG